MAECSLNNFDAFILKLVKVIPIPSVRFYFLYIARHAHLSLVPRTRHRGQSYKMKLLLLSSFLLAIVHGLGQNQTVTLTAGDGLLQLAGGNSNGQILLSADDWWGVIRAAEDLAGDFGKVTGTNLTLGNWLPGGSASNFTKRYAQSGPGGGGGGGGWGPPGGGGGGWGSPGFAPPPQSGGHNITNVTGTETTVLYMYMPVTGFVNVSSLPHLQPQRRILRLGNDSILSAHPKPSPDQPYSPPPPQSLLSSLAQLANPPS